MSHRLNMATARYLAGFIGLSTVYTAVSLRSLSQRVVDCLAGGGATNAHPPGHSSRYAYVRYTDLEYRQIGPEGTARWGCALMLGPPVPSPTGLCALPAGYGLGLCVP